MTLSKHQRYALQAAEDRSLHADSRGGSVACGWTAWTWGHAMERLDGRACRGLLLRGLIRQGPWLSHENVALFVLTEAGRAAFASIERA